MKRERLRIAVAGGGPAGLSAALAATRAGIGCVLYEKRRIGEGIQCAEGLFDPAALVPIDPAFIRTRIRRALLRVEGREFNFPIGSRGHFYVIDRSSWQRHLGERLREGKVQVREGEAVDPGALARDFDAVIDARGAIANLRSGPEDRRGLGFGVQWTLEGDFTPWQNAIEVEIYGPRPGYFWIFPKGIAEANVGFGWMLPPEGRESPWPVLEEYIRRRNLDGCRRVRKIGGFLAAGVAGRPVEGNIYRVGDAGGFASPLHGGGIDAAWLTGRLAVESIAAGKPERFRSRLNRELGLLRQVEQRVLDRWVATGPAALHRAAEFLQERTLLLRASLSFLTSGPLAPYLQRALPNLREMEYYRFSDE